MAYEYGANQIWIVNVGDIKPMEFPISFFMDMAWDPGKIKADSLQGYTIKWVQRQFGSRYAEEIADILTKYTTYNSRRKPELITPETYSLTNYQEAERIVNDYNTLITQAEEIQQQLPQNYRDAFYQLVLFPVLASANLNELYYTAAKNKLYAAQGRNMTNETASKVRKLFERDAELTKYYNTILAGGKWNHMMDQTHIGYTNWQQPDQNSMPNVTEIKNNQEASMGIAIEGIKKAWPDTLGEAALPEINTFQVNPTFFEIFNKGINPFSYTIVVENCDWLLLSTTSGKIDTEQRLWVSVDWQQAPIGKSVIPITIFASTGEKITLKARVNNVESPRRENVNGFVENGGCVSIEAEHFNRKIDTDLNRWQIIPNFGRTLSGITPFPVTMAKLSPGKDMMRLEYNVYLHGNGDIKVKLYLSPTLNFQNTGSLQYGVSFDDEMPQIVNIHADKSANYWRNMVANNINITTSVHRISSSGEHVLKIWAIDPGVVIQKIVIDRGGEKPSYLGPPESYYSFTE